MKLWNLLRIFHLFIGFSVRGNFLVSYSGLNNIIKSLEYARNKGALIDCGSESISGPKASISSPNEKCRSTLLFILSSCQRDRWMDLSASLFFFVFSNWGLITYFLRCIIVRSVTWVYYGGKVVIYTTYTIPTNIWLRKQATSPNLRT